MYKITPSKLFHETIGRVIAFLSESKNRNFISNLPDGIYEVTPKPLYISQLANAKNSKIEKFYGFINDLEACKRFGSSNLDDFSYWAWRSCGIVGLEMILKSRPNNKFSKKTRELIKEGLDIGGYHTKKDIGWYHQKLVDLGQKYGITAQCEKFVSPSYIAKLIANNQYVLASIYSKTGGHLLLVYGFHIKNGLLTKFTVHDPNNYQSKEEAKEITLREFKKLSTRRIIVFNNVI